MVLYDDKKWLCRLIRTGFSIDDDTGICEKVLKQKPYLEGYDQDSDSAASDESFEIRDGVEGGHRRRSNTELRLEKLELRRSKTETQIVKLNPDEPIKNELCFERDTSYLQKREASAVFCTSKLLEAVSSPNALQFQKYAQFEASNQPASVSSKTMAIFLTFLDSEKRAYPLHVSVTVTVKIIDLIGLILWLTSQNHPGVELYAPYHYNLQIADEDGEWDADFPPLDHNEPLIKFSFSHLALVKSENPQRNESLHRTTVTLLLPNRSTYRHKLENLDITIGELVLLLLKESAWSGRTLPTAPSYHLEKLGDPRVKFTDPNMPFTMAKCKDFCLVRDGAKSVQEVALTGASTSAPHSSEASTRTAVDASGGRPDMMFSCMIPVMVSAGRFNKLKNAMCVIWSGDRMDLEFQHKIKSYPLSLIHSTKYEPTKNKVVVSLLQPASGVAGIGTHYLGTTSQLTFFTTEPHHAMELHQHLNLILTNRK